MLRGLPRAFSPRIHFLLINISSFLSLSCDTYVGSLQHLIYFLISCFKIQCLWNIHKGLSMLYGESLFIITGYIIDTKHFLKAINLKKVKWQFFSKYLYLNEDWHTHKHIISVCFGGNDTENILLFVLYTLQNSKGNVKISWSKLKNHLLYTLILSRRCQCEQNLQFTEKYKLLSCQWNDREHMEGWRLSIHLAESVTVSSYSGSASQDVLMITWRGKVWKTSLICLPSYVKWHSLWKHALQSSLVL